jgi:hypothetical protein
MNIVRKTTFNTARSRPSEAPRKGQRRPLGLAPADKEVSYPSALDGRSADELASPATVQHVLEVLDAAVGIRSDLDNPLRVRIGHLESQVGELRSELAVATVKFRDLKFALDELLHAQRRPKAKAEAEAKPELRVVVK